MNSDQNWVQLVDVASSLSNVASRENELPTPEVTLHMRQRRVCAPAVA